MDSLNQRQIAWFDGSVLQFDEDGFLIDQETWCEAVSNMIAVMEDVGPLNDSHWAVIRFVRDRFLRIGQVPPMRHICRGAGLDEKKAKQLFGGCLQMWRIAGLPNPGEEARAYMV
ncbi:MAG: TusE/DsrC/DsvC family sulfur relay protein [Sedimenticola sp.]